jgi:hypothetical protein
VGLADLSTPKTKISCEEVKKIKSLVSYLKRVLSHWWPVYFSSFANSPLTMDIPTAFVYLYLILISCSDR